jgi:hypothetical protein
MFETNLCDERFLPFEGAGAISTWTLSLPTNRSFDYATISDVILHMRYTARNGRQALASQALAALKELPLASGATADTAPSLGLLLSSTTTCLAAGTPSQTEPQTSAPP